MRPRGVNKNPVTDLIYDSFTAKASRRDVMKRAGALGLSASMFTLLERGYGSKVGAQTPEAPAPGWALTMPEGLRTDLAGTELNVIQGSDGPTTPWEDALASAFQTATSITTSVIRGATSATDRLTQYQQMFEAESGDADAMQIDVIWPGVLVDKSVDLSEAVKWQSKEYFDRIVTNNTVNGTLVGIPWFTDAGILYYRKDLLEKYGYTAPPATWDELEEMATKVVDGEKATSPDLQGYVFQGAAYEGLTCDALEWQFSNGGGTIIETDGTVSVNNQNAIDAFTQAAGWIGTISPEGVTGYMEEEARGVWQGGNAVFMRNWPYAYSLGQASDSVIKDKFDVTLVPAGSGEGAANADCLGGWQFMVSKYAKNVDGATEYAKFITSYEAQKSNAIENSKLPTIPELYDDPDVLAANPFFGTMKSVFGGGAVPRPSTVSADLYPDVSAEYYTAINQILTGEAEAAAAIEDLEGKLQDIMSQV